jgi:drug/metabolite transporter (DMT)-like permease
MAISTALKSRWFWYSTFCVFCWGPWAIFSKLGSDEIPAPTMQFLFTLGGIPVALAVLVIQRFRFEKNFKGILYGLAVGILSAVGQLALFAAYRSGGNTAVITTASGLYPLVTVGLAVIILGERLTRLQILGVGFATVAFVIFSL